MGLPNEPTLFGASEPQRKRKSRGLADDAIGWWRETYPREVRDVRDKPVEYRMHPGDGPAVAALVRDEEPRGLTLAGFKERALALLRSREPFWIKNRNLRVLCSRWSDIASVQLADAIEAAPPKPSHLGQPPTFQPDPSFQRLLAERARESEERFRRMRQKPLGGA